MTLRGYASAVAAVGLATVTTLFFYDWIAPSISLLFFPAIVLPAMYGGYGPAFVATTLSTAALAYYFVPPRGSFNVGLDDAVRLAAFATVAFAIAWLGSARRRAEEGQRQSLDELQATVDALKKMSGWPIVVGPDPETLLRRMLAHAASVLRAETAIATWESDDEPWFYVATSTPGDGHIAKHSPPAAPLIAAPLEAASFLAANPCGHGSVALSQRGVLSEWVGVALCPTFPASVPAGPLMSAPFRTEHLSGRLFLGGIPDAAVRTIPAAEVVAREVGNSLDHLYLARGLRDLAVREDRLRVSRDLHDGVLQALTGIRLELKSMADEAASGAPVRDRLFAIERALAIEQRELRLFIDTLKPLPPASVGAASITSRLEDMCARLGVEWRVPVTVRVEPSDLTLPDAVEHAVRLMVHEAVVNSLKHGHPSRVAVGIDALQNHLQVSVADDGRGFPVKGSFDHDTLAKGRIGPVSLRERVTALKGRLRVESTASGSRLDFSIPLREADG
jgi:signal transduction histidine kinase